jgi:iron complex outermembrane receptor protein
MSTFRLRNVTLQSALFLNVFLFTGALAAETKSPSNVAEPPGKAAKVRVRGVHRRALIARAATKPTSGALLQNAQQPSTPGVVPVAPAPTPVPAEQSPAAERLQAAAPPPAAPPEAPPGAAPPAPAPAPPAEPPPAAEAPPAPAEPAPASPPPAEAAEPASPGAPEPGPAPEGPDAEPLDTDEMETVRVTVDRREKDIQDYPGSATAFNQEDLTRIGVRSVRDMAAATPYVEIGTQDGNTEVYVRGVGSNYNTELGDPAVANHIDGIYIPRPRGIGSMLFDLERIEINRGPQGTLRGRNATAGTLNVITAQPKLGQWDANASFQLGNYSQGVAQGMVNIPFGERFALRFAGFREVHDPFYENAGPVKTLTATENADVLAFRGSAKWKPIDWATVILKGDYTQEGGTGAGGSNFTPALNAGLLPQEIKDPRSVIYRGPQGMQDMKHWGLQGDITLDFGPVLVGYLGSYRDLDYRSVSPGNAGIDFPGRIVTDDELDNWGTAYWHTASQSVVQELRLFAPDTASLRWNVGGFLLNEEQQILLYNTADRAGGYLGGEYNMPEVPTHSYAGFVDATLDILKTLRGTAGVRVTYEERSRTGVGNQYSLRNPDGSGYSGPATRFGTEGFAAADRNRTDFTISPGPAPGLADVSDFTNGVARYGARDNIDELLAQGYQINAGLNQQHGNYNATFLDYRAGVDFDLAPDNLVYVMFSTGHQSGGFNDNIRLPNGTDLVETFKPEAIYATEIGSKNEFMDRHLAANFAAFWYEYRNQQFQTVVAIGEAPDPNTPPPASALRINAAASRVLGLESDVRARLPAGFNTTLALMLLESRFTEGTVNDSRVSWDPSQQPSVDLKGNFLPRAPVLSMNLSIGQTIPTNIGYFDWLLSSQTKSKHYFTHFNGEGVDTKGVVNPNLSDVQPTYVRFDAGIGYTRPDGKLRLDGFVNNLTDTIYLTTIINNPGLNLRFFNPPRQTGVRLTVSL